jgi:hypothetical protein
MTLILRFAGFLGAALILAGAAEALEGAQLIANESHAARYRQAPATEQARDDSAMQAVCREILVDTDEGYGVTNRESRVICDELR